MNGSTPLGGSYADVAQLVEHHLAKVRVAGSNPVVRSGRGKPVPASSHALVAEMVDALVSGISAP